MTFLCLDNHRALCPSVPPAMTQGNVTCQSQTPTYNRCPPLSSPCTPPTWNATTSPPPSHPDPNCSSPGETKPSPSPHSPLLLSSSPHMTPHPGAALYPNGSPPLPPSPFLHSPPGLQNMEWDDSSEWESQGWEVDFLSGPRCACFQLLSRPRRGGGLCVIWECN